MPFIAVSTNPDGCICSDSQRLDAINQNISSLGNALVNDASFSQSASFTRPDNTTAYDALDVVSTAAGTPLQFTVAPAGGAIVVINSLALEIDASALPSGIGAFRLHLYNELPSSIADGAAFNLPVADRAQYLGFIETPTPIDLGATLWSETEAMFFPIRKEVALISETLFARLQTVNGYTPTALVVKKITVAGFII